MLAPSNVLALRRVDSQSPADRGFLWSVLQLRLTEPDTNISHKVMPSWEVHCDYLRSAIYCADYIIEQGSGHPIGRVYIDNMRSVGIWIAPDHRGEAIGSWALDQLIERHGLPLYANVNPANRPSLNLFRKAGFVPYALDDVQLQMRLGPIWGSSRHLLGLIKHLIGKWQSD